MLWFWRLLQTSVTGHFRMEPRNYMSTLSAGTIPFDDAWSERVVQFHPLETRRARRARLETAEVAMELGNANPPLGGPIMKPERTGVLFSDERNAAGTDTEPA